MKKRTRFSADTSIIAAKEQVFADLGGEVAILHLKSGIYYGLDSVGARIWDLIRVPRKASEIRDFLLKEYDIEPGRCWNDLSALLRRMESEGLIDVTDGPAS